MVSIVHLIHMTLQLNRDKAAFDVAKQCSDLFVLSRLDSMASALLEFGYFDASQIKMLRAEALNTLFSFHFISL